MGAVRVTGPRPPVVGASRDTQTGGLRATGMSHPTATVRNGQAVAPYRIRGS